MNDLLLKKLTDTIVMLIKADFQVYHLSKNLINTITITKTETGYLIDIPARVYDIKKYREQKVIIYTSNNSYAEQVDVYGGFSKKHKEYIERSVLEGIDSWLTENNLEARIVEV